MTTIPKLIRLILGFCSVVTSQAAEFTVNEPNSPMLRFGLGKLEVALKKQSHTLKRVDQALGKSANLMITVDSTQLNEMGAEGFRQARADHGIKITGTNERGAMYGVLAKAQAKIC